jgi:hypothetical protein
VGDRTRGLFATPADSRRHDCSPYSCTRMPRKFGICPSFKDHFLSPCALALRFAFIALRRENRHFRISKGGHLRSETHTDEAVLVRGLGGRVLGLQPRLEPPHVRWTSGLHLREEPSSVISVPGVIQAATSPIVQPCTVQACPTLSSWLRNGPGGSHAVPLGDGAADGCHSDSITPRQLGVQRAVSWVVGAGVHTVQRPDQ